MHIRHLAPIATAMLALTVAALPTLAATPPSDDALKNARDASAAYTDPAEVFADFPVACLVAVG